MVFRSKELGQIAVITAYKLNYCQ